MVVSGKFRLSHLILLLLPGTGCKAPTIDPRGASGLSSFVIGNFVPPPGSPAWVSLNVGMQRLDGDKANVDQTFAVEEFKNAEASNVSLVVTQGTYNIALNYVDSKQRIVYAVCGGDRDKKYLINTPTFATSIPICMAGMGGASIGQVAITPASNFTFKAQVSTSGVANPSGVTNAPGVGMSTATSTLTSSATNRDVAGNANGVQDQRANGAQQAVPKADFNAPGNSSFQIGDYGPVLRANKGLLAAAADANGASSMEKAVVIAIAMQETTHIDINQHETQKNGTSSANRSVLNMNYDMLTKVGYTIDDNGASLDDPANLKKAVGYMIAALRQWGVASTLDYQRGGSPAFADHTSYGAYEYRNAIATIYKEIAKDLSLESDGRRVEINVPGV